MKLELEINNTATERLVSLYLKDTTSNPYAEEMKREVEEYASRLLTDCIRAKYNYYQER